MKVYESMVGASDSDNIQQQGSANIPAEARPLEMVLVDQGPIRDAALEVYRQAKQEMEELKARLSDFRDKEIPAFRMWMHRELGQTLSRVRELEQRHADESALHAEILRERDRNGGSFHAAWQRVKARREAGIPEPDDFINRSWQTEQARRKGRAEPASKTDKPRDDEGWENLSDEEFEKMAEAFQAVAHAMAQAEGDQSYITSARETVERERKRREGGGRLKRLYRRLARMLHPDANTEVSESKRRLWEEVQEAYHSGDATQLELLILRIDSAEEQLSNAASVSLIKDATDQTNVAIAGLKLELLYAEEDPAWGFFGKKGRSLSALKKKTLKSLENIADGMRGAIKEIRQLLDRWATGEGSPEKTKRRKGKAKVAQGEFKF
jgi:hypothetical protein